MKLRKLLSLTLAGLISSALLVGCSTASGEDKTIKVGASPTPHAEILEVAKPLLEKEGYKLEIVEFDITKYIFSWGRFRCKLLPTYTLFRRNE